MRCNINIRYEEKDKAKEFGAKWDWDNNTWYLEGNIQDICNSLNNIIGTVERADKNLISLLRNKSDKQEISNFLDEHDLYLSHYFKDENYELSTEYSKRLALISELMKHCPYYQEDIDDRNIDEEDFDILLNIVQNITEKSSIITIDEKEYYDLGENESYSGGGGCLDLEMSNNGYVKDKHVPNKIYKRCEELGLSNTSIMYMYGETTLLGSDCKIYKAEYILIENNNKEYLKYYNLQRDKSIIAGYIEDAYEFDDYIDNDIELDDISMQLKELFLSDRTNDMDL